VDVVYGNANHIDTLDEIMEPYNTEDWDYERLKQICFICQPSVFFRRRIVDKLGLLDKKLQYCMDYEYWLRLGQFTNFVRLDQTLAGSRLYKENKTLGSREAVHKEINDMFKDKFGKIPDRWIFNYAHIVVDRKGYNRTSPTGNFKFIFLLASATLFSYLRWRQVISFSALRTVINWFPGQLKSR